MDQTEFERVSRQSPSCPSPHLSSPTRPLSFTAPDLMQSLPSPTPSNSADDRGATSQQQQLNLKRQRSESMRSAASDSSPKRAQSLGPTQDSTTGVANLPAPPAPDYPMSALSPDAAEDGVPSPAPSPLPASAAPMWSDVPAQQKALTEQTFLKEPMEIGQTWYLVSMRWYARWHKAVTGSVDKQGPVEEKDLGPVDNSDLLVDAEGKLVEPLVEDENVKFVPEKLWQALVAWYGEPKHPLPRKVRGVGVRKEPTLELRPPTFATLRLVKSSDHSLSGTASKLVSCSSDSTVDELRRMLLEAVFPEPAEHWRVWTVLHPRTEIQGLYYPTARLLEAGGELLLPDSTKTIEQALIQPGDVFVVEVQDAGTSEWLVDEKAVPVPGQSQKEAPLPLFSSENDFFSRMEQKNKIGPANFVSASKSVSAAAVQSGKTLAPNKALTTTTSKPRTPGTMGLGNMGNTCFMNSALQCLTHQKELVDYFLTGVYKEELNPSNPLGMGGAIAESFGALLQRIWTSQASSYAPREFKQALQRFAPQFSGYQQHDSQELVAFLLDGLHEDLNRILKKPYVEKPDWEGGGDKELVELANKSWEGYLMRNDSVIVDLFQGQYRSTLVCPECEKVSITFDPFMYLTLPLPVNKKWRHEIYYVPWDLEKPHLQVHVEINHDASYKDLRNLLGRWLEVDPTHLVTMEIFHHKFYKHLDDNTPVNDSQEADILVCYELPCNSQMSRGYKRQPDEPFVLPVFLSQANTTRTTYGRGSTTLFGYPFFVAIEPEQATSVERIGAVLTDRLSRWTAQARDLYRWELPGSDTSAGAEVTIPIADSVPPVVLAEIQENGDVVEIAPAEEEGDIADEKGVMTQDSDTMDTSPDGDETDAIPQMVGPKPDVFTVRVQGGYAQSNTTYSNYGSYGSATTRFDPWENRESGAADGIPLLKEGDALFCEFDENMQLYYFGEARSKWEHASWNHWEQFVHPEVEASRKASTEKKSRGISLQDCLDEFTKEEKLGEDDLWYCPQCKKHQQATKKFDLWKVPDILVVHLKRFSNNRSLRDKIDTFVDFPIEGLDLQDMVHERKVAEALRAQGVDISALGLRSLDEPLMYDLFAVDEHLGGLGGGHYRAYALNHETHKWYHFDDSYVTEARPQEAVNANAYLLFYKRRTDHPLGGKTNLKIEEARAKVLSPEHEAEEAPGPAPVDPQLPTPPDEDNFRGRSGVTTDLEPMGNLLNWPASRLHTASIASESSRGEPPGFDESQFDDIVTVQLGPGAMGDQFDFPDPSSSRPSPSSHSSLDGPAGESDAELGFDHKFAINRAFEMGALGSPPDTPDRQMRSASPIATDHPVGWSGKEIPIEESTLNDIE